MQTGSREEAASPGGGGGTGGGGGKFHSPWGPPRPSQFLQVTREGSLGGLRQLVGGGTQPAEGMDEVGDADASHDQGGGGCPDLGTDILGSGPVGPTVRIIDVGDGATHQDGVGRIPPQGGLQADRGATLGMEGQSVEIPPDIGRDG